jgi:hypothetical protein
MSKNTVPTDEEKHWASFTESDFDPLPDDPGYPKFLAERARLERGARRLFRRRRPISGREVAPARQLLKSFHASPRLRRFRRNQRRQRVRHIARSASSGVGNESSDDGPGEPPPHPRQVSSGSGHKRHEGHHVDGQLSRVPGGRNG